MKVKIIDIVYDCDGGRAEAKFKKYYQELPDTLQMDCLLDALYDLQVVQENLHDEMYPKNEVKTYET